MSQPNYVVVKLPFKEQVYVGYDLGRGGTNSGYKWEDKTPTNKALPEATLLSTLRFQKDKYARATPLAEGLVRSLAEAGIKCVRDLKGVSKKTLMENHKASDDAAKRLLFAAKLAAVYVPGAGWPAEVKVPVTGEMVRLARLACNDDEKKAETLLTQLCANYVLKVDTREVVKAAADAKLAAAKKLREQADKIEEEAKAIAKDKK